MNAPSESGISLRVRLIGLLILLLLALLVFVWRGRKAEVAQARPQAAPLAARKETKAPAALPEPKKKKFDPEQPIRYTRSGGVRLKPGESAVVSFLEIAPGMNGMLIVTPELQTDGKVSLNVRLVQITDEAVERAKGNDLLANMFDVERYGAVGQKRLDDFLSASKDAEGMRTSTMPAMTTNAGGYTGFNLAGWNQDGSPVLLMMHPKVLPDGQGFDLDLDFRH